MRREIYKINSDNLQTKVEVVVYGHFGMNFLMFPISDDDPLEYEKIGLIEELDPLITKGHIKLFSVQTNNLNSWLNEEISPSERSNQHYNLNQFIANELVQFIYDDNGSPVPIVTCGAGIGGYHAMNTYLRRPDIFMGTIAANSFFDIQWLSKNFYDENCYFNSPLHYLPNLTENYWLSFLQSQRHLYLIVEQENQKMIRQAYRMSEVLNQKEIGHKLEIIDCSIYPDENVNKVMLASVFKSRL